MGYNELQTQAYNHMLYIMDEFAKLKKLHGKTKCAIHNQKLKLEAVWEEEYDVNVHLSGHCCKEFALTMAKPFVDFGEFTHVYLKTGE